MEIIDTPVPGASLTTVVCPTCGARWGVSGGDTWVQHDCSGTASLKPATVPEGCERLTVVITTTP